MNTDIGPFDADRRTVTVTFAEGEIVHERVVNACLDEHGGYDVEATTKRVEDVARGVAVKIGLGVIRVVEDEPSPIAEPTGEDVAAG